MCVLVFLRRTRTAFVAAFRLLYLPIEYIEYPFVCCPCPKEWFEIYCLQMRSFRVVHTRLQALYCVHKLDLEPTELTSSYLFYAEVYVCTCVFAQDENSLCRSLLPIVPVQFYPANGLKYTVY